MDLGARFSIVSCCRDSRGSDPLADNVLLHPEMLPQEEAQRRQKRSQGRRRSQIGAAARQRLQGEGASSPKTAIRL